MLFFVLFAFGFVTARIAGINFWMQLGYLSISAFVGLNPQEPVPSQAIINTFLYLAFGNLGRDGGQSDRLAGLAPVRFAR